MHRVQNLYFYTAAALSAYNFFSLDTLKKKIFEVMIDIFHLPGPKSSLTANAQRTLWAMSKYGNIFNFVTWLAKSKNASGSIFEVGFFNSFPRVLNQATNLKSLTPIFPVFSFNFSPKALLGHLDVRLCITDFPI